jgi:acetylglutamate kinase
MQNTQPDGDKNMQDIIVVKIGGSTLGQHDTTLEDLVALQKQGKKVVVVHGGGKVVTDWLGRMGVQTKFVQGERVTDKTGLEIAAGALAGLVNKELTAYIISRDGKAIGISGVDGGLIKGQIKNPEAGYVGKIIEINTGMIDSLLGLGYMPVISSIGLNMYPVERDPTLLLNINADVAAGELAAAIKANKLIFLTDINGVRDQSGNVITKLSRTEAETLITSGVATSGMIPKIRSCIRALDGGAEARIIDGRQAHALLKELESKEGGTTVVNN